MPKEFHMYTLLDILFTISSISSVLALFLMIVIYYKQKRMELTIIQLLTNEYKG